MLRIVHDLAKKLKPFSFTFPFAILLLLIFCSYIVISNSLDYDHYLLPNILLIGWLGCLYAMANGFVRLPSDINSEMGFIAKIKNRIKLLIAWLFALLVIGCTLGLFYLSYLALRLSVE